MIKIVGLPALDKHSLEWLRISSIFSFCFVFLRRCLYTSKAFSMNTSSALRLAVNPLSLQFFHHQKFPLYSLQFNSMHHNHEVFWRNISFHIISSFSLLFSLFSLILRSLLPSTPHNNSSSTFTAVTVTPSRCLPTSTGRHSTVTLAYSFSCCNSLLCNGRTFCSCVLTQVSVCSRERKGRRSARGVLARRCAATLAKCTRRCGALRCAA